jgi:hypothetical protein
VFGLVALTVDQILRVTKFRPALRGLSRCPR